MTTETLLQTILDKLTNIEAKLTSVEARLTSVEARLTSVEARLTSIEARLTSIEARLTKLETRTESSNKILLDMYHGNYQHSQNFVALKENLQRASRAITPFAPKAL